MAGAPVKERIGRFGISLILGFTLIWICCIALTLLVVTATRRELLNARISLAGDHAALGKKLNAMHEDYQAAAAEIARLRGELRLMRMRVASLAGQCDPEITRLIFEYWRGSRKVLTLAEMYRLVWVESRCDPFATDGKCFGVMQLDPQSVVWNMSKAEATEYLIDPDNNIRLGLAYLDHLATRYKGDKTKILTAWQWGPTRMANGITTGEFARKVLR